MSLAPRGACETFLCEPNAALDGSGRWTGAPVSPPILDTRRRHFGQNFFTGRTALPFLAAALAQQGWLVPFSSAVFVPFAKASRH